MKKSKIKLCLSLLLLMLIWIENSAFEEIIKYPSGKNILQNQDAKEQKIVIKEDSTTITIDNGLVEFSFNKKNADLISIRKNGGNNLLGKKGSGYLMGPGFSMHPSEFRLVRHEQDLVEISFYHEADNSFQYDLRYVIIAGESGAYCYLAQTHRDGDKTGNFGQTRWGLRADESLFDYHLVRDNIRGPMPKMDELKNEIQDWTYRLADSSVYTKYDYADYIEGRHVHGYAGTKSGLGVFVIQASHEYLNGGPTKQYNTVHSNPYLICMFNCGHFLSDIRKGDGEIKDDWQKLNGPFFIYVNEGKNIDAIWEDAKKKADREIQKWPYQWMKHQDYPIARGTVSGKLMIKNAPAAHAHIILASPGFDWQAQSRGYIFSVSTDKEGKFIMKNVRQGSYSLYSYAEDITEEYRMDSILVSANSETKLGKIEWQPKANGKMLWQIGKADRTTAGFKLSDHKRNYGVFNLPPADLTFTIGKSNESEDWYYAQTKQGAWNISFQLNDTFKGDAFLTIGIAGAAKNPGLEILVNDTLAATYSLGNDASVYRSAILGGYYQKLEVKISSSKLKTGSNTISLRLSKIKYGGGVMYDVIRLETN